MKALIGFGKGLGWSRLGGFGVLLFPCREDQ